METIKVNMNPNPLDVQTIHASQNDTEARQWEFELHNNGELIDTSNVKEQMVFKAYKGGTEQLLPENGSTPTTSPFKGDIKYPNGLLTDQEFLYRESPTEEDGLAKITDIKGNTLVWNQLVENGNFVNTSGWFVTGNSGTISVSNNILSFAVSDGVQSAGINKSDMIQVVQGHKYFVSFENKCSESTDNVMLRLYASGNDNRTNFFHADSTWSKVNNIITARASGNVRLYIYPKFNVTSPISVDAVYDIKNVMVIDLTAMGLDSLTVEQFISLFPLPFYDYNQGSLLSFMGNGIKTVGKNLFDENSVLLSQGFVKQNDGSYYKDTLASLSNAIVWSNDAHINGAINIKYQYKYINGTGSSGLRPIIRYTDGTEKYSYPTIATDFTSFSLQTDPTKTVDKIVWDYGSSVNGTYIKDFIISVDNISYEPYTSSTLSLPIEEHFPNGMNGVNNVHDELNENNAITRFARVTYNGTESGWALLNSYGVFYITPSNMAYSTNNAVCDSFSWVNKIVSELLNGEFTTKAGVGLSLWFKKESITTVADWKTYLSNNPVTVVYELATPTETSFTTASLVTENAEIPLSNEDGVLIGKCTEQLSENPGFFNAKIKLSDADGDVYSNKIQLHVERSPQ